MPGRLSLLTWKPVAISELYNRIKLDPDYRMEYQTRLSQLQSDFFEGKINSKEYDAKLHELSKTDSLISEFLQRPDVQQEYNNEFQEMKSLKQNMHKEATRSGIPCITGLIIGSVGLAGGAQAIVSSVDIPEDEEKNTHGI